MQSSKHCSRSVDGELPRSPPPQSAPGCSSEYEGIVGGAGAVGDVEGRSVGLLEGAMVATGDGGPVGTKVGRFDGAADGSRNGRGVGCEVGWTDGIVVGWGVGGKDDPGPRVGFGAGARVLMGSVGTAVVGVADGACVGVGLGCAVGRDVGAVEGAGVGAAVGAAKGTPVGMAVGVGVGIAVGGYTSVWAWNTHWLNRGVHSVTTTSFAIQWSTRKETPVQPASAVQKAKHSSREAGWISARSPPPQSVPGWMGIYSMVGSAGAVPITGPLFRKITSTLRIFDQKTHSLWRGRQPSTSSALMMQWSRRKDTPVQVSSSVQWAWHSSSVAG